MRQPQPHPFLAARDGGPSDAVIVGLPLDDGSSFRAGAAEGPGGIRRFSESIESYSPRCGRDLEDLRLVDVGDSRGELPEGPLVAVLGGDHSVTPKVIRAMMRPGLAVVGFDAHLDLRKEYAGEHACTFRRIAEAGVPVHLCGPRSGERAEWEDAPSTLAYVSRDLTPPRSELESRPVYVTVDIDVLDPSVAPGVGNPEPGGPGFEELLVAIESLEGLNIVGFDVVEVAPPLDPSGITQVAAAVLVREMLLRFTSPRARGEREARRS